MLNLAYAHLCRDRSEKGVAELDRYLVTEFRTLPPGHVQGRSTGLAALMGTVARTTQQGSPQGRRRKARRGAPGQPRPKRGG